MRNRLTRRASVVALFCLCLLASTSATQLSRDADQTSAISGVITDGASGHPLHGVMVTVHSFSAEVLRHTLTDSKGRFVFPGLPPDETWIIRASKPGYVGGDVFSDTLGRRTSIALGEDEWLDNFKAVMWRLGGISGFVEDERGEAVVGVPVRVFVQIPVGGSTQWAAGPVARTDDRGYYRIAGLRRGAYIVNVPNAQSVVPPSVRLATGAGNRPKTVGIDADGSWFVIGDYAVPPRSQGPQRAYPVAYFPGSSSFFDAQPLNLDHGEERRGIDFRLRPVSTVRVAGRITNPDGALDAALEGIVVRLLPQGVETEGPGSEQATTLVTKNGDFEFLRVPAGNYTLDVRTAVNELMVTPANLPSTPGLASVLSVSVLSPSTGSAVLRVRDARGRATYFGRRRLSVGTEDVSGVVVEIAHGSTIRGRIVRDSGKELPRTIVHSDPAAGDPALVRSSGEVILASDGKFSIAGLEPGDHFIRVHSGSRLVKSIVADDDYTHKPITVWPGTDVTNVVVTLTDSAAAVSGVVRDKAGNVAGESTVVIFPTDRRHWSNFGLMPEGIAATASFGRSGYRLRIPAGEYLLVAVETSIADTWLNATFFEAAAPLATRVSLDWGDTAKQDLTLRQVVVR